MIRAALLTTMLLAAVCAEAHPMSRDKYSLRTALRLSEASLDAVVVLEVPMDVVTGALREKLEASSSVEPSRTAAKQIIAAYAQQQWDQMAAGLTIEHNGAPLAGAWRPRQDRYNGKGAVSEGFFLYIVEFVPDETVVWGQEVQLRVQNKSYADAPMVYSTWVIAGEGWRVASDSSSSALPDRPYEINDPAFWVDDPSLRELEVRYVKTP